MRASGQPRPVSSDFGQQPDGSARKLTFAARWGKLIRHPGHASSTQEDDHGDSSAHDVLDAATRALEQGQAHRPEAAVAAKARLVDPYQTADGTADARLVDGQSRNR